MKKLIVGALCALFFIACGDSSGGKMSKEEEKELSSKADKEIRGAKNVNDKLKIAKKYCDKGLANSCQKASNLIMEINPSIEAFDYYVKTCEYGEYDACFYIARMYKGGDKNSAFEKIANLDYNPEKIIYYLKKACEFGACVAIGEIESGDNGHGFLKEEDAKKYINIDEYVKRRLEGLKECDENCNFQIALIYLKGADAGPEYRDVKKAKEYLSKVTITASIAEDNELLELIKKYDDIKAIFKERCDGGEFYSCEIIK